MDKYRDVVECIIERRDMPERMLNLRHVFKESEIEDYMQVCINRIIDAHLVDGEHIVMDYANFDNLVMDYKGLMSCEGILNGYIKSEVMQDVKELSRVIHEETEIKNRIIRWLRSTDKHVIETVLKNNDFYKVSDLIFLLEAELKARKIFNMVRQRALNCAWHIGIKIKYWRLFMLIRQCKKEFPCE